jgi:hypothetical protein
MALKYTEEDLKLAQQEKTEFLAEFTTWTGEVEMIHGANANKVFYAVNQVIDMVNQRFDAQIADVPRKQSAKILYEAFCERQIMALDGTD